MQNATIKTQTSCPRLPLRVYISPQLQEESHSLLNSSARLALLENIKFYEQSLLLSLGVSEKVSERESWRGLAQESRVNYRPPLKIHSSSW